ncbi:MAG: hypothetical protein JWM48_462 [Mycobacterium sp.]|nr:hypothetical protein [Mycobacterium sp.]
MPVAALPRGSGTGARSSGIAVTTVLHERGVAVGNRVVPPAADQAA